VLDETARLYRKHGVKIADGRSLFSTIVQMPIFHWPVRGYRARAG